MRKRRAIGAVEEKGPIILSSSEVQRFVRGEVRTDLIEPGTSSEQILAPESGADSNAQIVPKRKVGGGRPPPEYLPELHKFIKLKISKRRDYYEARTNKQILTDFRDHALYRRLPILYSIPSGDKRNTAFERQLKKVVGDILSEE